MARIDFGNALNDQLIQPGWTVSFDGFGLATSTTTYRLDSTTADLDFLDRGTAHPDSTYSYLKVHKCSLTFDTLGLAVAKVDYVGIEPSINSGTITNANTSSANGLTSEPLTTHPNFFSSIAGSPTYTPSPLGPMVDIKDSDDWLTKILAPKTIVTVSRKQSCVGNNGACFEEEDGGRFIGFVDPSYPAFYGKTNYLARTTSYSGQLYTTLIANVQAMLGLLNSATDDYSWGSFVLLPAWAPVGTGTVGNQNLLSQVNVEEFGSLYKVSYEIRYSYAGWHPDVYANV